MWNIPCDTNYITDYQNNEENDNETSQFENGVKENAKCDLVLTGCFYQFRSVAD
jgi:hypothetical protein